MKTLRFTGDAGALKVNDRVLRHGDVLTVPDEEANDLLTRKDIELLGAEDVAVSKPRPRRKEKG